MKCDALRADGAQCSDERGHYGGHVWPEPVLPILRVGDTMRWSLALIRTAEVDESDETVLVRVKDIITWPDGTKVVSMEKA